MKKGVFLAILVSFIAAAAFLATGTTAASGQQQSASGVPAEIEGVRHEEVCMVTDRVFGKPQIPVEFEGRTYYGCCNGCVGRIRNDEGVRRATDPVTGGSVDKALAVIKEGPGGEALYFESAASAREYLAGFGR